MKRTLLAALLSLSALAVSGPAASAQCPGGQCGPSASFGPSCGPFCIPCFRLFSHIHQHGPLYNYGPYAGYYPFEPYGPWDANLNYNGPLGGQCGPNGCGNGRGFGNGRNNCGNGGLGNSFGLGNGFGLGGGCGAGNSGSGGLAGLGGLFGNLRAIGGNDCDSCSYSKATFKNVFFRSHPLSHRAKFSTGCCVTSPTSVGCGTSVTPQAGCSGGCSASASGTAGLDPISLVAAIEAPPAPRYYRER